MGNTTDSGVVHKPIVCYAPLCVTFSADNSRISYQQVQRLSPIETAIRYLPNLIVGGGFNIVTGLIVHRLWVNYYVVGVSAICAVAPLLLAICNPSWSFWACNLWTMVLVPVSVDGAI